MTASVASMVRPKVPRSLTKPMSLLESAAPGAIEILYVHGLMKICMLAVVVIVVVVVVVVVMDSFCV